jgi:ABC-type sulfate transport system permease subunit
MTSLEGLTLFTTGVRVTILIMLITVLWNTIRTAAKSGDDIFTKVAHSPKILLALILTLLTTSVIEVSIEMYDHWRKMP